MKKSIISITLLMAIGLSAFAFTGCSHTPVQNKEAAVESNESAGFVLSDPVSSGVKLMSTTLLSSEYTDYGVSLLAESAYTLTATIEPESAANQKVDWSMAFTSANTWSQGKNIEDYITLAVSEDTKTSTISCNAPFGCQITVTASSQENPSAKATCTLDYAQKVTSASLSFGNIPINLGGDTFVKYEVAQGVQGNGGVVAGSIVTSDVYSLADTFTESVTLTEKMVDGKYFAVKDLSISNLQSHTGENVIGQSIYYDYDNDISKWFIMQRAGDILFKNLSTAQIIDYLSNITQPLLYEVTYTVTGKYNTYTYTSNMKCNGYTNNTPVKNLNLNESGFVF